MGGLLMVKAAAYGWLGGLIAAPFLWLPALGVSVWILVREPRSRAVLLPLAAAWGLCLPLLWHMMAGDRISTLRNWIVTGPVYLLAALSIALLIGTAWYAMRQMDRRWKKRLGSGVSGPSASGLYRPAGDGGAVAGTESGDAEGYLDGDRLQLLRLPRPLLFGGVPG